MDKVRLAGAITTSVVLAGTGYLLAGVIPLPSPATAEQTRVLYLLLGVLVAQLIFARLTAWVVRTVTILTRQLVVKISSEIINQIAHITSTSFHFRRENENRINNPVIIDTSSLIDGRVLDVVKSGFISGLVLVPDFILRELQQVADSADSIKRVRGRRGFEIIEELKKTDGIKLQIWDQDLKGKTVDEKLVNLGKVLKGKILTVDYNLNRVASLSSVRVLNVNDLGNALKTLPVPGEILKIKVVHLGKDHSQGVGYLSDGTMVVVKNGARSLGQEVSVEVTKILQGSAGRMIFTVLT